MLVDMHLHALPHSTDSFITLEQIVYLAKEKGLDGVLAIGGGSTPALTE